MSSLKSDAKQVKNPSCVFTTNSSESINRVIKLEVEWRESQLPQLIESLKLISSDQNAELEKAVVNRGEWQCTQQHTGLTVSESRWFSQMSEAVKKLHLKKYSVF